MIVFLKSNTVFFMKSGCIKGAPSATSRLQGEDMSWQPYYEKTRNRPSDPVLDFAQSRVCPDLPRIAIDCGCGAGRNAEFLRGCGFEVHGFDPDPEAIQICSTRFGGDAEAHFSCDSFFSFDYPQASLVVAAFSLFFCPADEFAPSWDKIVASIVPGGVFYGTFLGPNDTWAKNAGTINQNRGVISHTFEEVQSLFSGFEIEGIDTRDFDGTTAVGNEKHWHTYSVIARRKPT